MSDSSGPAFPQVELDRISGQTVDQHFGMSLRDYFAAKVMASFAADAKRGPDTLYMNYPVAAREAYAIADAMLAERAK